MQTKYLLPCSCGREIPIEASQAGQTIRCQCGADLEAPRLMRMSSLKRAEQEASPARPRNGWGTRQRLVLLGALLALPGIVLTTYLLLNRPKLAEVPTHAPLDSLTISETWNIWLDLRTGIQRHPTGMELYYQERLKANRQWTGVALAICGLGVLVMASSLLVPQPRRRPAQADRDRPAQSTGTASP